jgi:hypothetical protein
MKQPKPSRQNKKRPARWLRRLVRQHVIEIKPSGVFLLLRVPIDPATFQTALINLRTSGRLSGLSGLFCQLDASATYKRAQVSELIRRNVWRYSYKMMRVLPNEKS